MGCGKVENEFYFYIMIVYFFGEELIFKGWFKFQCEFDVIFCGDIFGVLNLIEICCSLDVRKIVLSRKLNE